APASPKSASLPRCIDQHFVRAQPRPMIVDRGYRDDLVHGRLLDEASQAATYGFGGADERLREVGGNVLLFRRRPVGVDVVQRRRQAAGFSSQQRRELLLRRSEQAPGLAL